MVERGRPARQGYFAALNFGEGVAARYEAALANSRSQDKDEKEAKDSDYSPHHDADRIC